MTTTSDHTRNLETDAPTRESGGAPAVPLDAPTLDAPTLDEVDALDAALLDAITATDTVTAAGEDTRLAGLHHRLEADATAAGLLDVAYRTLDSPVGPLLVARTRRGLVRIAFAGQRHEDVLADLSTRLSPRILHSPGALDDAARQLDAYFAGRAIGFDLPLDHALSHGFRALVQSLLPAIRYGETISYAELARRAGNAAAVRAVGTACGANPLPIVVPCHRVVRADGSLGGYAGGLDAKRSLLALEANHRRGEHSGDTEQSLGRRNR